MVRHRQKKNTNQNPTLKANNKINQPTKTKPLLTFLLEFYKAWTETVETVTKGCYDISSLTGTYLPH